MESSFQTCGTREHYRPLRPNTVVAVAGESPSVSAHSVDIMANASALIDDPPLDFFSPADVFTEAQLCSLMTYAQQVAAEAAEAAEAAGSASTSYNGSLDARHATATAVVFANPHAPVDTSSSECQAQQQQQQQQRGSDAASAMSCCGEASLAVLELPQLAVLGVPFHSSPLTPDDKESAEQRANGTTLFQNEDSRASGGISTSPPDLATVETRVMTPPPPPKEEKEEEEEDTHSSSERVQLNGALLGQHDSQTTVTAAARAGASCVVESASCPLVKRRNPPRDTASGKVAADGVTSLSFDERCRRWMRLLVRTSAASASLQAQPLCLDCWVEACLVPLQQRTKNALESMETLTAVLRSPSRAEHERLSTLISVVPTAEHRHSPFARDVISADAQSNRLAEADSASSSSAADSSTVLPLSLDAVATNVFGTREGGWLDAMAKLAVPHDRHRSRSHHAVQPADLFIAERAFASPLGMHATHDHEWEEKQKALDDSVTDEGGAEDGQGDAALQERYTELHRLLVELQEVRAEQTAIDVQRSELQDVLLALDSAAARGESSTETPGKSAVIGSADSSAKTGDSWAELASKHNMREVHAAFTGRDESAERQHMIQSLSVRHAYLAATSIDALCFPVDVSGPIGTIAGLRLGLVPPYAGASTGTASTITTVHAAKGMEAEEGKSSSNMCAGIAEEAMFLEGFERRQVQYTQLLLSGNTEETSADALKPTHASYRHGSTSGSAVNAVGSRVSLQEVNAACGYFLLLLNYLAQVNGFSFQTAILRPAGDRSTVALLKRVPRAERNGVTAATAAAAASSTANSAAVSGTSKTSIIPFNFFGLFAGSSTRTTERAGARNASTRTAMPPAAAAAFSSARSSYTVDYEVDFYITDRLFAWRTFGSGCVAVASCVRELADALHESLRYWRVREKLVRRRPPEEEEDEASASPATTTTTEEKKEGYELPPNARGISCAAVPVSLPRLVETLDQQAAHSRTAASASAPEETHGAEGRLQSSFGVSRTSIPTMSNATTKSAIASVEPSTTTTTTTTAEAGNTNADTATGVFPLHPPFRIQNDTVDGFSVRHGSVSEPIWTLGMKKLLANLQWCMEATVELERLYAISGEGNESEADEV